MKTLSDSEQVVNRYLDPALKPMARRNYWLARCLSLYFSLYITILFVVSPSAYGATITVFNTFEFCKTNVYVWYRIGIPLDEMCGLGTAFAEVHLGNTVSPYTIGGADNAVLGCNATCEWRFNLGMTWYPAKPASQPVAANLTWRIGPDFCEEDGGDPDDSEDTDSDSDESDDPCDGMVAMIAA